MTVLVVGNLDCELEWAEAPPLPRHVAGKIAAAATLLRALVPDDHDARVWVPGPVDRARVPEIEGSPRWELLDGALPPHDGLVLQWGATARVNAAAADADADLDMAVDGGGIAAAARSWRQIVAALPATPVAIARRASDRRWAHDLAARAGTRLSGARTIVSVAELAEHLATGGADASPTGAWVVKAPLTAAGRDRVRRRGTDLDAPTAQRIQRLLDRSGALVFEPWMDRVVDIGQPGVVVGPGRWHLLPAHELHSDATGGFAGITIHRDDDWLAAPHRERVASVGGQVAAALAELGYRGAFTIDAFVHRDRDGEHLHALAEINPRLSFGLVARAWSERLSAPLTLRLAEVPPPAGARVLVHPVASERTAAWLELA